VNFCQCRRYIFDVPSNVFFHSRKYHASTLHRIQRKRRRESADMYYSLFQRTCRIIVYASSNLTKNNQVTKKHNFLTFLSLSSQCIHSADEWTRIIVPDSATLLWIPILMLSGIHRSVWCKIKKAWNESMKLYCIVQRLHSHTQNARFLTCIAVKRKGKCNNTNEVEDVYIAVV